MIRSPLAARFLSIVASLALTASTAIAIELHKGDHICIIGNTLAERMQHHGWLETRIHARFPAHELVFRNLGYSGDEIDPGKRLRSMDFGTPDQWLTGSAPVPQPGKMAHLDQVRQNRFELTNTKADLIFAFFGYNESYAGEAGLPQFKQTLDAQLKHMLGQKYNGRSAPRIVLFSPNAHENLKDRNLPDGSENNARLKLYTAAMAEVAAANNVPFVDLFTPSLALYRSSSKPLTINGIHLNELGDRLLASIIEPALFPQTPTRTDDAGLEKLNQAVRDKNFHWFHRYRTTDGYSTYGDRAFLAFTDKQSNYEVLQRELEILDVMTSNRDRRVWQVAQAKDGPVDDSNVPGFVPVVTNKPGPLEGGRHVFLGGLNAIEKMSVHKDMQVELFASEEDFPELINPVQMAFDTKGRLWVAAWPTYPHWKPLEPMNDKLLILEDTNHDGKADKCTAFVDDIHNPTGFEFWGGGVLVAQGPDILFLKDTDGDDKCDVKVSVLHGLDTADTHHTANSFTLDPGGALYFQEGTFHHTQVESPWTGAQRVANGAVFRYEPRAQKFDVYVSFGFANPHGHAFDRWGQDLVYDGTGANPFHAPLFSGHVDFPQKHNRPPQVYQQRTRPCPGVEFLSSSHFPPELQGNLLVGNVIGFQGILQYKMRDEGSSFGAEELEPIVFSTDANFRPADLEIGPDGALYFTDWQNPIIGHMQHNLRDPSRDRLHGRVYRVTYKGRELARPVAIAGQPVRVLLDLLKSDEDRVRYRARIELSGRDTQEVMAALEAWSAGLDKKAADFEHHQLEALWLHQHHNVVDTALLDRVLASQDFRARAAATRVLCYWRDRVSNSLDLLRKAAADPHPRVRLEAVRAASFYTEAEAVEVPLIAAEKPSDTYLDFLRGETLRTLDPYLKKALAENRRIAFSSEAGARFFLKNLSNDQLLKEERTRAVYLELLYRPGLRDENRQEAIRGLARLDKKPELKVIMDAVRYLDEQQSNVDTTVVFDLVRQLTSRGAEELGTARTELEKLATTAQQPVLRQIGFVSLINVDGNVQKAWKLATGDAKSLQDFVSAMPLIADASVRASLYDRVEPLLQGLPEPLSSGSSKGTYGRFVRIELPRSGTLTLAEVEVMSAGQNVARRGKATQKNTAHGGDAARGIDGNKNGEYGGGGQTHTEENTANPWWEVDLGEEQPIDQIVIYNRTDGDLGKRLDGFTLSVLDSKRNEVFKQDKLAAPARSSSVELAGGGPAALVRRAAMTALTYVRGQELKTFQTLASFVREDVDRTAAIRALQRLPKAAWPKEEAAPLLNVLLDHVRKIPAADRTTPAALDALEFADALTALLPADEAKATRAVLGELGVRVIRIGTIFEKMSYDKETVVVKAGKPVEFLLENSDLMPHNFVIAQPGSMEEIGLLAESSAQQPGFAARQYVPESGKVLASSRLLQPRDSQKLSFTAPAQPGVYPYVCTYPGHWRRMYGALYVVEDLDEYQAAPDEYLALHKVEPQDALLKDRRPRTEWKLDDLAGAIAEFSTSTGRNYGNGKQLFTVASCVACHKLDGAGNEFGPDLTKLEAKYQPLDIIKEMLDPSAKINEKFQTFIFTLKSGKVLTALVLKETPDSLTVVENPLAKTPPVEIKKSDIEEKEKSPISIMPKGLLDKLTREEILDLVAYVAARGNKNSPFFKAGDGHHHGGHNHGKP